MTVINPPESKLAKPTSVQCAPQRKLTVFAQCLGHPTVFHLGSNEFDDLSPILISLLNNCADVS